MNEKIGVLLFDIYNSSSWGRSTSATIHLLSAQILQTASHTINSNFEICY